MSGTSRKRMMVNFENVHDEPVLKVPVLVIRCTTDVHRNLLFVNEESQRLLGFSAGSLKGAAPRSYAEYIHPADREMVLQAVRQSCLDAQPYKVEYRLLQEAERELWVCERGQSQVATDGSPS
jgi:PAS domain-containing protein